MGTYKILTTPGDGIGPEILVEATKALQAVAKIHDHRFEMTEEAVGGAGIDAHGVALRPEGLELAKQADAVLFGAVGDPRFDDPAGKVRPEQAILGLRKGLGLFANLRPVQIFPELASDSPLRPDIIAGTDMVVVRELTGGIYFGQPQKRWTDESGRHAVDTMVYAEHEVRRILHVAFKVAQGRRKVVTSVDKANVLDTSRMWREIAEEVATEYPDVKLEHILVDAAAMHLVRRPSRFDVVVTENMFGDILTDEAAMIAGSLGLMPSASLGERRADGTGIGLYEPIHGSAPDIAGQGKANPVGMILSAAMLLRHSLGLEKEAVAIERAVAETITAGHRTADIAPEGAKALSTAEMGDQVVSRIR